MELAQPFNTHCQLIGGKPPTSSVARYEVESCATLNGSVYGATDFSLVLQENFPATEGSKTFSLSIYRQLAQACSKPLPIQSQTDPQPATPHSTPPCGSCRPPSSTVPRRVFPFPAARFLTKLYCTRSLSHQDHTRDATGRPSYTTGRPSYTTVPMTRPFTHEINHTVAALAATTRLCPPMPGKSSVELRPQRALRPQISDASTAIRPVYRTCKHDGVVAGRHAKRDQGGQMVWLEVKDGRANVMVDEVQYNNWRKRYYMKGTETDLHGLRRDALSDEWRDNGI
jgi:hypothetical protein